MKAGGGIPICGQSSEGAGIKHASGWYDAGALAGDARWRSPRTDASVSNLGGDLDVKEHWERVWKEKAPEEVSWYQPTPTPSLRLIREFFGDARGRVLDVGGGASRLVDHLLGENFPEPGVLDLSAGALAVARQRLGAKAPRVEWIEGDVTEYRGGGAWDLWHDRAVLHFLTGDDERRSYRRAVLDSLKPGGGAVIATFAPDGPERCSGLPVRRQSADDVLELLGSDFRLLESSTEDHRTPSGARQQFSWALLQRRA